MWVKIVVLRNSRREAGCAQRNTLLGRATFFAEGEKMLPFFFAIGGTKKWGIFFLIIRSEKKKEKPIFLFAVVDKNILAPFAIRRTSRGGNLSPSIRRSRKQVERHFSVVAGIVYW